MAKCSAKQDCADADCYDCEKRYDCADVYMADCVLCGRTFSIGDDGNELGFCETCMNSKGFPYDLDAYYRDYDAGKVAFKDFETMQRGILEPYRKDKAKSEKKDKR